MAFLQQKTTIFTVVLRACISKSLYKQILKYREIPHFYRVFKYESNKPVILYATTWGSKKNKLWGLHNLKYLSDLLKHLT